MELFFLDVLARKLFSFSTRKSHVFTLVNGSLLETEAFWPLHWLPDLLHLMLTSFCDFLNPHRQFGIMPISRDFIYSHWLSIFHHMEWNLRVPRFKTQTSFGWVSFSAYMTANTIDNDPLLWTAYHCPVNSQNKGTGALMWVSSKPGCPKTTLHFCQQRQFATRQISTWIDARSWKIFWWNLCLHMLNFSF